MNNNEIEDWYCHQEVTIDRFGNALNKARADEHTTISKILSRGSLHSKEKAFNDVIEYIKKSGEKMQ